jgi:hypothetical protein
MAADQPIDIEENAEVSLDLYAKESAAKTIAEKARRFFCS